MNRKEYNSVVKDFSNRLFGFFVKNCQDISLSEDLVQDTYEKLWENKKKVDFDKAKSWLFTTGYRLMLNAIKKENRTDSRTDFSDVEMRAEDNRVENKDLINFALACLSEQQRSIVLLRDYEGYDYKEIGNILNLNESQVKVYLFRARTKLKEKLKGISHLVA